ncbi:olfactory receptor 52K1-like [Oncorhynchus nerka]|uniref:olfactory receptor 52K1-like n=1 Tax=Oncorhynchus nerka TaxID=8023 RepID=UPI0031B82866
MLPSNYTRVSVFVIVGFPGLHPSFNQLVAWFFFFIYVITVVGNILLVVLFALERSLQKPMYIIMLSLALSDIVLLVHIAGFCTVALPKVIARYWWDDAGISFFLCLIQKQFIHYFGALTSLIMMTMAMDKYLAICYPLSLSHPSLPLLPPLPPLSPSPSLPPCLPPSLSTRYNELMTNRTMSLLTALSWVLAMISPAITTIQSSQMPFCGSNRINHCYCDTTSLNQLSCADISSQSRLSFSLAMVVLFLPFGFIVFSYVNIIFTVMRMANAQGRMKTFSTCATQGCIILIYYIPRFIVNATPYIPNLTTTPDLRISLAIFSSLLPPLLNPFIYCIRTKEIRAFLAKWTNRGQSNAHHKPCIHPIAC